MQHQGYNAAELLALERLAREPSSEKRRELMSRLSDVLLEDGDVHSVESVNLLGQTLVTLLDQVEEPDRVELSVRVAAHANTPRQLAVGLARDPSVNVAEPVLSQSAALTDDDLAEIARDQSEGHLIAMSRRDQLSATVTDAMIGRGSLPVSEAVAGNPGAEISENGFSRLAADATSSDGLAEALSERTDIPQSVAQEVIAGLPPQYQLRLEKMWSSRGESSKALLDDAAREMSEARLARKRGLLEAKAATKAISAGIRSLDQVISDFAGANRLSETAHVVSARANLPDNYVRAALYRKDSTIIAVICRSIGLNDTAFEEITRMRCSQLGLPASDGHQLLQAFRSLDVQTARRTVRFAAAKMAAVRSGGDRRSQQGTPAEAEAEDRPAIDRRTPPDRRLATGGSPH